MALLPFLPSKQYTLRFFCWLFLQKACCLYAQIEVPGYDIRRFSVQNGMDDQIVNCVVKEQNNNLWIGTSNGLYRYDGFRTIRFDEQLYQVPIRFSNFITDLAIDPESREVIFVCSKYKAQVIDIDRGQYVPGDNIGIPDAIFQDFIQIERGNRDYFFGLQQETIYKIKRLSAYKYSCEPWFKIPPNKGLFTNMVVDRDNPEAVWLLQEDGQVWYASPEGTKQYRLPATVKIPNVSIGLLQLVFTPNGIFGWDVKRNIYKFDSGASQFMHAGKDIGLYDLIPNLAAVDIAMRQKESIRCSISLDINQEVFGTSLGLFIVRKKITGFHTVEAVREEEIRAIHIDSSGRWAIGTYTGLYTGRENEKKVKKYPELRPLWGVLPLSPDVWLLGLELIKGLQLWNPATGMVIDSMVAYNIPNEKAKNSVLSVQQDKYGINWVGTYTDLLWSAPSTHLLFRSFKDPVTGASFAHGFIRKIFVAQDSSLWIGSDDGLFHLVYNTALKQFQYKSTVSPVGKIQVSDIYEDHSGCLWVATKGKGLARIYKSNSQIIWYDIESGLSDNMLSRIESSRHDSILWISTHNGLSRMTVHTGMFHNFYEESGFPGNEFNSAASCRHPDGRLFFGGVNGLIYFNPDSIFIPEYQYVTAVPYVQIYSHRIDSLISMGQHPTSLQVAAYPELLEFVLVCNERIKPDKVRYRYRLLGLSDKWNYTTGENKVKYVHLSPGKYTFQVQAMPLDGHLGEIFSLPVLVETPFTETVWFWLLIISAIMLVPYAAYRYQIRQIQKEQLIRQQIADDLHDDIGNKLNIIGILTQKVTSNLRMTGSPLQADTSLKKLYDLSRDTQISLLTMIWAVDPSKDGLVNLINRMQDFADDFLRPLVPQFSFVAPKDIPDRNISLRVRHHLMLIYQELLVNMIKHTHTNSINVHFLLHGNVIKLIIINLHSANPDQPYNMVSDSRGKNTLNRRLREINGSIDYLENIPGVQKIIVTVDQIFKNA